MDGIGYHHLTTLSITPQAPSNFKFHYFIIIQYYSLLLHIIIQK